VRIVGLTGGIASGKSTVARFFRELGAPVVDADALARQVVEPGSPGLARIVERFGSEILDERGALDRKRLGAIVFASDEDRRALNAITHPLIAQAAAAKMHELAEAGHPIAIYEAALIVENDLQKQLQGLIVVSLPAALQLERLQARDGLGPEEARARLDAQFPLDDKVAVADFVIDNSGAPSQTRDQVVALWKRLLADAAPPSESEDPAP
jgi:dephospho-CoA kinase